MGRKCVVPKCNSGLGMTPERISMFSVPKNKLEIWQKALPTKNRQLTHKDCVCMKHFRESDIIREVKTEIFTYPLQIPKLKPDAIPSIFPIFSNYQLRPRTEGKCLKVRPVSKPKQQPTKSQKRTVLISTPERPERAKPGLSQENLFKFKLQQLRRLHKNYRHLTREKYNQVLEMVVSAPPNAFILRTYNYVDENGVKKLVTADKTNPLYYVHDDELFQILSRAHIDLGHASSYAMSAHLKKRYKNVVLRDIVAFRRTCPSCKPRRQPKPKRPKTEGEVTLSSDLSRRCSVSVLNYQWRPSGDYAHVMIYQNSATKFCWLSGLQTYTPTEVARNLADIFSVMGVSDEIESSIRADFWTSVAAQLKIMWPGLRLVHVRTGQPDIVGVVNEAIGDWMEENGSTMWIEGLSFIQLEQNKTFHGDVETTPYDALFGLSDRILQNANEKARKFDFACDVSGFAEMKMDEFDDATFEADPLAEDPLAQDTQIPFVFESREEREDCEIRIEDADPPNDNTLCVECGAICAESEGCPDCFKKRLIKGLLPKWYNKWDDEHNIEEYFTTKLRLSRQTHQSRHALTKERFEELVKAAEVGTNYNIDYQVMERDGVKRLVKTEMKRSWIKHYVRDDELFFVLHYTHINLEHAWLEKMVTELKKRFANIATRDIMTYLHACPKCYRKCLSAKAHREPLIYSDVSAHCSINVIDYHRRSDGSYKYVLVYQNHSTKFCMLKALFSLKPSEVAHNLIDIFTFVGVPTTIESNEDWTFIEDVIGQLKFVWEDLEIEHLKSDEYEDVDVISQDIKTWMDENKTIRWTKGLRFVQLARNQEYHSEIEGAPYSALFGISGAFGDEGEESKLCTNTNNGILDVAKSLFPELRKTEPTEKGSGFEKAFYSKLAGNRGSDDCYLSKDKYCDLLYQVTAAKITKQTDILKKYGVLFIEGAERLVLPTRKGNIKLYIHDDDLFAVLQYVHNGLRHAGTIKMSDYLSSHFVNIHSSDILTFCQLCPVCVKKSRRRYKTQTEYMASSSMSLKCSIDLISVKCRRNDEFKYAMIYQNNLTGFCLFRPMKTKTPEEVADNLIDIFTLMGACEVIQSREKDEFVQKVVQSIQNYLFDFDAAYGGVGTCAVEDIQGEIERWITMHNPVRWSKILPMVQLEWNKGCRKNVVPYEETFMRS